MDILKPHRFCLQFPHNSSVANNNFIEGGFPRFFLLFSFFHMIKESLPLTFSLTPELCMLLSLTWFTESVKAQREHIKQLIGDLLLLCILKEIHEKKKNNEESHAHSRLEIICIEHGLNMIKNIIVILSKYNLIFPFTG